MKDCVEEDGHTNRAKNRLILAMKNGLDNVGSEMEGENGTGHAMLPPGEVK